MSTAGVTRQPFGATPAGKRVDLHTLVNARGTTLRVSSYGAIITSLVVADRDGRQDDIVLGFDTLDAYVGSSPYFGAAIGRYANRIAGASFELDGTTYHLPANDGANTLHGGTRGFDKVVWQVEPATHVDAPSLTLRHLSPAGDQGFPGALHATVRYTVTDDDRVVIDWSATTDAPTPVNLTQHSYFNLGGAGNGDILEHRLTVHASRFTPVTRELIPTGALRDVSGSPFDFRKPAAIGSRIDTDDEQLHFAGGYDHNFVIDRHDASPTVAAVVADPRSGRRLTVSSTEPGLQCYSGNFLDGTLAGKQGVRYQRHAGLCLESQHFPDSVHHADFPSTILRPGATYRARTIWAFDVDR